MLVVRSFLLSYAAGFFCWAFAIFCSSGGRGGVFIVLLAWLTFLIDVGLAQFFVGVALLEFSVGRWSFAVFCLGGGGENVLLSSRG